MRSDLDGWKLLRVGIFLIAGWSFLSGQTNEPLRFFDHLTTKEGLSYSRVRSFFQDSTGFIWVGTESGLNRYDGYGFTVFRREPEVAGGLLHDVVPALLQDSRGNFWIGTRGGLQLLDSDKNSFFPGPSQPAYSPLTAIGQVLTLLEDRSGQLWVGTARGLFQLGLPPEKLASAEHLREACESGLVTLQSYTAKTVVGMGNDRIWSLAEDREGYLWIGTEGGLYRFDPASGAVKAWPSLNLPGAAALGRLAVRALQEDAQGHLWIGTADGLYRLSADRRQVRLYQSTSAAGLINDFITCIVRDGQGAIWVGSDGGGLAKWEARDDRFVPFGHERHDARSLGDNNVEAIYADRNGGLWVGHHKGISYWNRYRKPFILLGPDGTTGLEPGTVTCFAERPDGNIWIGVDDGGLSLYDRQKGIFHQLRHEPGNPQSLPDDDVVALLEDSRGALWIGTWGGGLTRFAPEPFDERPAGRFTHYGPGTGREDFPAREVWTLYEDRRGQIWIGTVDRGLVQYDPVADTFRNYPHQGNDSTALLQSWVLDIGEDEAGQLWVATTGGISRLDRSAGVFTNFPLRERDNQIAVYVFLPDPSGAFWLGTRHGLKRFDPQRNALQSWQEADGLPDAFVTSLLRDEKGDLWLGTGKGLSTFYPASGRFRNYDEADGLQAGEFSGAHLRTRRGEFLFGGINGINLFHPDSIRDQSLAPAVVLTDFELFHRSLPIRGSEGDTLRFPSPLLCNAFALPEIRLQHWQDDLAIAFAALNYLDPEKNRYKYRLDGYREDWVEAEAGQHVAYYTNLSPGAYTFRVTGSNNDGVWNEQGAAIDILIAPPWWATGWAYGIYVLAGGSGFFFLRRNYLNRRRLQRDLELEQIHTEQLRKLGETKSRLYTNITHEFRTPLTVILGMADQIEQHPADGLQERLGLIRRNGRQLLTFINQLLDLAKLQASRLELELIQGDVAAFLQYAAESFQSIARAKGLRLTVQSEPEQIFMDFDRNKLLQVLSNLLSNAIKFTPAGGEVELRLEVEVEEGAAPASRLVCKVRDSGIGIPKDQQVRIFERFFQGDVSGAQYGGGTGIGLALTQELVKLMQGDITVESKPAGGSVFAVRLPIRREAPVVESLPDEEILARMQASIATVSMPGTAGSVSAAADLPLLLVVEDNPDVRRFVTSCLEEEYRIAVAENGQAGIAQALGSIPDLIISDVMMPEADGFELCDRLKDDIRTSHIPIILLTARAAVEDRISGLRRGADAYMAKPFHRTELLAQVQNLLEGRRRLRDRYQQLDNNLPAAATPEERVEDAFLLDLRQLIEDNMHRADFSIDYLLRKMAMSRMQLHRKIKALTGRSTSLFIRRVRLQRARTLLSTTDLNISEIAYEVGFDDPKYFSRVFSEEFGVSPTTFRENKNID